MTDYERKNPNEIRSSRKQRIAKGSGTQVSDVNKLLTQYERTKVMMKQMAAMGGKPNMQMMQQMQNGTMPRVKGGSGKFQSKLKKRR